MSLILFHLFLVMNHVKNHAQATENHGTVPKSAAQVGHELKTSNGWSTVIASLHSDAQVPGWVQVGFMEAEHLI